MTDRQVDRVDLAVWLLTVVLAVVLGWLLRDWYVLSQIRALYGTPCPFFYAPGLC